MEKLNIYAGVELQDLSRKFGEINKEEIHKNNLFYNPQFNVQYIPKVGRKYRLNYTRTVRNPSTFQSSTVINDIIPTYNKKRKS